MVQDHMERAVAYINTRPMVTATETRGMAIVATDTTRVATSQEMLDVPATKEKVKSIA